MRLLEDILDRLSRPVPSAGPSSFEFGELPGHIKIGGVSFGALGWAVELKETLLADMDPVSGCKSIGEAVWTYIHLSSAQYLGIVAWNLIFLVTTIGLCKLIHLLWRKRNHRISSQASR